MKRSVLFALMIFLPLMAAAEEGMAGVSAGAKYSSGDYGTEFETRTFQLPLTLSYMKGGWSLSATLSYMQLQSDGNVTMTSGGPIPDTGKTSGKSGGSGSSTLSGMGDTSIEAGYAFFPGDMLMLKPGVIVKIATADESQGLGTGENDYSLQLSAFKSFDKLSLSGNAGYTLTGDNAIVYNDIFFGSAGLAYRVVPSVTFGGSFYYAEPLLSGYDPVEQASLNAMWSFSSSGSAGFTYTQGLSDAAADQTMSLILSFYF